MNAEPESLDPDYLVRWLREQLYGHLERRLCTADSPMASIDVENYRWSHPDATVIRRLPAANVVFLCHCPHCGLTFPTLPAPQ